jgi:hypothetical protein
MRCTVSIAFYLLLTLRYPDNYATSQIDALVSQANVTSIVFVNADSGEGYINVDGNEGDRQNLTLWHSGDDLIKNVSALCSNTIVVIHSTGPVLVTDWYDSANVTAIVWAGVPGQESGNSITDVLYGKINPAARTPFTWGPTRSSYGTDLLYEPNNGQDAPQDDFLEGVFIDYRAFDAQNITPIYEFGYGLSYTTFEYSNLTITSANAGPYTPTTGLTEAAPVLGNFSTDLRYACSMLICCLFLWELGAVCRSGRATKESLGCLLLLPRPSPHRKIIYSCNNSLSSDYLFPNGSFQHIWQYIYPYLNSTDARAASADPNYGQTAAEFLPPNATDGSPQPLLPAGGGPGGNPELYDVLYTVTASIKNTGTLNGEEVPQLYVSLGGANNPKVVLRGFDRLSIDSGETATFSTDILRRDLSNWDTVSQNWYISSYPKTVYVGPSSRNLPLSQTL